jgi:hypothetical protein
MLTSVKVQLGQDRRGPYDSVSSDQEQHLHDPVCSIVCQGVFSLMEGATHSATNIAVAGMKNATWQGSNGVITEGANPSGTNNDCFFKSVWVRALNELYRANSGQSSLAILIHSYIDVQVS